METECRHYGAPRKLLRSLRVALIFILILHGLKVHLPTAIIPPPLLVFICLLCLRQTPLASTLHNRSEDHNVFSDSLQLPCACIRGVSRLHAQPCRHPRHIRHRRLRRVNPNPANPDGLQCVAYGYHRNFHRKVPVVVGEAGDNLVAGYSPLASTEERTSDGRRRVRTKFSVEQKKRMLQFSKKIGWRLLRRDGEVLQGGWC